MMLDSHVSHRYDATFRFFGSNLEKKMFFRHKPHLVRERKTSHFEQKVPVLVPTNMADMTVRSLTCNVNMI